MAKPVAVDWKQLALEDAAQFGSDIDGEFFDLESMVEDIMLNAGPAAADTYMNTYMSAIQ